MNVEEVELRRVRLPVMVPFGVASDRDILLVRVTTGDGASGWGECGASADPRHSEEDVASARQVIRDLLLPMLFRASTQTADRVGPTLAPVRGHRMAKAALEMAVLDAELRGPGTSLSSWLGAVRDRVPAGVSVGVARSIPMLLDAVHGCLERGYRRITLKIRPGWDVTAVRAVRERFGDIALQVDANAAYRIADAAHLSTLDDFDLLLLEQPFAGEDLRAHAALAGRMRTPICLGESITSAGAAAEAI